MKEYSQAGFSTFKLLALTIVLVGGGMVAYKLAPVYYAHAKVQKIFEATSREMANDTELKIRARLPVLFKTQNLKEDELPQDFYDNLEIDAGYGRVELQSHYHKVIWLMGPLKDTDPNSDYDPVDLKGMDKIRNQARVDLDFEVHAKTP